MKKHLVVTAGMSAILAFAAAQPSFAVPSTINDRYWGGEEHGRGDVIGRDARFGIDSMEVERIGDILSVSINTNFAGRSGIFPSLTNTSYSNRRGISYGDLFLNETWDPNNDAHHYSTDNYLTGTAWSYAFSLDDRWSNTGGNGTLYSLTGDDSDTLLSEDFLSSGTFRNGQEIAVDTSTKTANDTYGNGRWNIVADTDNTVGKVNFLIDLTGTSLANSETIALHWGMSCGNDTIEGLYTVPEPSVLALLALGLVGVGVSARKNTKR